MTKMRQVIKQIQAHTDSPYFHWLGGSDQLHKVTQCPHTFNIRSNNWHNLDLDYKRLHQSKEYMTY